MSTSVVESLLLLNAFRFSLVIPLIAFSNELIVSRLLRYMTLLYDENDC